MKGFKNNMYVNDQYHLCNKSFPDLDNCEICFQETGG